MKKFKELTGPPPAPPQPLFPEAPPAKTEEKTAVSEVAQPSTSQKIPDDPIYKDPFPNYVKTKPLDSGLANENIKIEVTE